LNRKVAGVIIALSSLGGLALLYYSVTGSSGTGVTAGEEDILAVSISNVKKDVTEYTVMKDYNGGIATRECGSLVMTTFTLTNTGNEETAVIIDLTARGEQIQMQNYILKAGEELNGSLQGSYPKCSLDKETITLKASRNENT
jgi:hypothetical protein